MSLTLEQKRNLAITGYIFIVAQILAVFYTSISDGYGSWYPFINAFIIATAITGLVGLFEFVVFTRNVRKKGFRNVLILRVSLYTVSIVLIILGVLIFTRMIKFDAHFMEIMRSQDFRDYLRYGDFKTLIAFVCALVVLTNFTMQLNRKMGQGVLLGFVFGKYSKPREVQRYLMFIKMVDALQMSEKMGNEKYLQFVNEVLYDITDSILNRKGFIVEYVDSEMLISWQIEKGSSDANCVRMFFEVTAVLMREKLFYYEKYGGIPAFVGALHMGDLVLGEVGQIKSEIVYIGDAINTTHRMLRYADQPGQLVISQEAYESLEIPSVYQVSELGVMRLRGKQKNSELKLITEAN